MLALQVISAVLLTSAILIQSKGTGFGRAWGGSSSASFTRRGLEKVVFRATFVFAALFIIVSILQLAV